MTPSGLELDFLPAQRGGRSSGYTGFIMSKRPRWRPRRFNTLLVGYACMLALIIAMGLQVQPFTYLWVSLYTGVAVAILSISLNNSLEKKYLAEHRAALDAKL